jgi:hypothetical protein
VSIVGKITVSSANNNNLKGDLVYFLKQNYPNIVVSEQRLDFVSVIQANTGSCRLQIAELSFNGSTWDLIQRLGTGADSLFVVFRGRVYTHQPTFTTVIYTLWSICLRKLGLIGHVAPVIAVTATSSCEAEQLPWSEMRD